MRAASAGVLNLLHSTGFLDSCKEAAQIGWLTVKLPGTLTHVHVRARHKIEAMCFRLSCDCLLCSLSFCFLSALECQNPSNLILFYAARKLLWLGKHIGSSEKYSSVDRPIFTLIFIDVATNYLNQQRGLTKI